MKPFGCRRSSLWDQSPARCGTTPRQAATPGLCTATPDRQPLVGQLREGISVVEKLYASASINDCTSITVGAAIDILGFDWCVVSRADHDSGRFEVVALAGNTTLDVGDRPLALDEGSAGRVYRSREPEVVNDVDGTDHTEPTDEQIESAVTAPIGDWGVLQAIGTSVERFGPRDRGSTPSSRSNTAIAVTTGVPVSGWQSPGRSSRPTAGAAGGSRFEITGVERAREG